jgi:hypothetical protein
MGRKIVFFAEEEDSGATVLEATEAACSGF